VTDPSQEPAHAEDEGTYFGNLVKQILKNIKIKLNDVSISYSIDLDPMAGPVSCSPIWLFMWFANLECAVPIL
jgi:hypothetical protein